MTIEKSKKNLYKVYSEDTRNLAGKDSWMIDNSYKYKIIDETEFNNKYSVCNSDGSKYKKYILVCYKENDNIKYVDIPDESYLDRLKDIIKTYSVEEIVSTCTSFDSMYNEAYYFHVDDFYFIKYLMDEELFKTLESNNDYEIIIDKLRFDTSKSN